jgi:signal transduction histidine kinase
MIPDVQSIPSQLTCPALALDADGIVVALNAAMARLAGHGEDAMRGRKLADFSDSKNVVSASTFANCKTIELRMLAADSTERFIAFQLASSDAKHAAIIGFDMSRVRFEERRLQEDAERYHDMATAGSDTLHESVAAWEDGRGVLRIWGARRNDNAVTFRERVAKWPDDIVDMSYKPEELARYFQTLEARKPYKNMIYRLRRDDREIYVRASAVPFFGPDGEYRGYRGISVDVTKQVLAERALKESQDALARMVGELAAARDAAQHASQAKSAFLANMSHELRTPLNAIIGFSEMISGQYLGEISPRYQSYGEDIRSSGNHLLELINQILDLSKVEAGRMELQESEFAPSDVLASCSRLLQERARKAEVSLDIDVAPHLPRLWADELKFKQIVLNLATNAIKFTPAGGSVTVCAKTTNDGLVVEVRDTGIGMHAEDIPLALEPFRQVGDDTRRKQQGTGLGLPLAKAFIELHGGSFAIASRYREGTTVRIAFPAERIVAPRVALPA